MLILSRRIGQKVRIRNPDGFVCWCWIDKIGTVAIDCNGHAESLDTHRIHNDGDRITVVYKPMEYTDKVGKRRKSHGIGIAAPLEYAIAREELLDEDEQYA